MARSSSAPLSYIMDDRRAEFDRLYFKQKLALRDVARQMNVSVQTLVSWTNANNIRRRNRREAQHNRSRRLGKHEKVIRLRLVEKLTVGKIAERLNYSSKGTVHAILAMYGLTGPLASLPSYEQFQRDRNQERRASIRPVPPDPSSGL